MKITEGIFDVEQCIIEPCFHLYTMEEHIRIGYMELLYIENAVRDLHDYEYVSRDPARGLWFKCY